MKVAGLFVGTQSVSAFLLLLFIIHETIDDSTIGIYQVVP